jgi:hypothetical protein
MLNQTNLVSFEWRNGSIGVASILYTGLDMRFGCQENARAGERRSGNCGPVSKRDGWVRERAKFRPLITNKRRKRSRFLERLIRLDKESYERHASVGARGEPIGN